MRLQLIGLAFAGTVAAGCTHAEGVLADVVVDFRLNRAADIPPGTLTFNVFDPGDYTTALFTGTYAYLDGEGVPPNSEVFQLPLGTYDLAGVMENDPAGSGVFAATGYNPGQEIVAGINELELWLEVITPNELTSTDFIVRESPRIVDVTSTVTTSPCPPGAPPYASTTVGVEVKDRDTASYHAYLYTWGSFTDLGSQPANAVYSFDVDLPLGLSSFTTTTFMAVDGAPETHHGADIEFGIDCTVGSTGSFAVYEDGYQVKYFNDGGDHVVIARQSDDDASFWCDDEVDGWWDSVDDFPGADVLGVKWEPDAAAGQDQYTVFLLENATGGTPATDGIPTSQTTIPCGPVP